MESEQKHWKCWIFSACGGSKARLDIESFDFLIHSRHRRVGSGSELISSITASRKDQNSSSFLESQKTPSVIVFQPGCESKLFRIASKSVLLVIRSNWKLLVRKQWNWMVSSNFQVSWTPPNQENWSWWLKKFFGHQNRSSAPPVSRKLTGMLSVLRLSLHYPLRWIFLIPQFPIRLEGWKKDQNWSWWLKKIFGHQNRI